MKYLLPAIILFIVGLVFAVSAASGYRKAQRNPQAEGEKPSQKSYITKLAVAIACFAVAQILLFINGGN